MEHKQKLTLAEAHDFAGRIVEMLGHAVEAEAVERENVKARAELENLVKRNEQLKSENVALQTQNESLKKEFSEYRTVVEITAREKQLKAMIAEETRALQALHRDHEALRQKYAAA